MLLVVLSHPHNGWSMVKFSVMLQEFINCNQIEAKFVKPSNAASKHIKNRRLKRLIIYIEKKIIFPIYLLIYAKKIGARLILVSDHSDFQLTLLLRNYRRIVVCHDLFAIQAMLGDIENIKQSVRERFELRINYAALKQAQLIIAVSEATKVCVKKYLPDIPIKVLYLTVKEINQQILDIDRLQISKFGKFCLLPMNSHWRKNRLEGIRAWFEIQKVFQQVDLQLIIIGNAPDQDEREFLSSQAVAGKVHFLNDITEGYLKILYCMCEFVLFTSRYEGFGLPIIEANSLGKLTLHSDLTSLNEIAGKYNVQLNSNFHENNWVEILNYLCTEDNKKEALNFYNRTYSNERFSKTLNEIIQGAISESQL